MLDAPLERLTSICELHRGSVAIDPSSKHAVITLAWVETEVQAEACKPPPLPRRVSSPPASGPSPGRAVRLHPPPTPLYLSKANIWIWRCCVLVLLQGVTLLPVQITTPSRPSPTPAPSPAPCPAQASTI